MTVEITTMNNGLRVVTDRMPHVETVALGVYVATGARHETLAENGISHLLEHMAFKGTRRRTARQIAEEIEQVGGDINAATGLETTAYFARVLRGDETVAIDILADILQNPSCTADDLAREKDVILQEIAGINDSPEELAYDLMQATAFPDQPLGRPIIGTRDSVSAISDTDIRSFLDSRYRPPQMIIAAAGATDHARLVELAAEHFGALAGDAPEATKPARYVGGTSSATKTFEQAHLLIGFDGIAYHDPQFYGAQVFSGILGGGMSSRLFQEIRENRGLCYSIYSSAWGLGDVGMLTIHAATGTDKLAELVDVVGQELQRVIDDEPTAAEVHRAKAQIKVGLLSGLESTAARADQLARHLMVADRVIPTAELIARIDAVTGTDIRAIARRILKGSKPTVTVVGAGRSSAKVAKSAQLKMSDGLIG